MSYFAGYGYFEVPNVRSKPTRAFDNGYTSTLRIEPGE